MKDPIPLIARLANDIIAFIRTGDALLCATWLPLLLASAIAFYFVWTIARRNAKRALEGKP